MTTLEVTGIGMVTALGFNAPSTLAAMQAGISGVNESNWVDPVSGEPLQVAKVALPHWWEGPGKFVDLLAPAIEECLQAVEPATRADIPLLIGVSSRDRPGRAPNFDRELWLGVHAALDLPVNPNSALFPADQVGCAQALARAGALIESGNAVEVVVAGVDGFLSQSTLDAYIERRRVMTPSNSNGFFPGEAGCAVLVRAAAGNDASAVLILGQGFATEEATIDASKPFRAVGMTRALREALKSAGVTLGNVSFRLTDLSGEHYKFKEAAFAAGRLSDGGPESTLDLWHPIEFLGEIGAAILPCLLAQAMDAMQQGYAPGPLALCHVGSDSGARAAFVVGLRQR
jgi:3-oxoacyl-[acyl-carrier-protein] synthase-1